VSSCTIHPLSPWITLQGQHKCRGCESARKVAWARKRRAAGLLPEQTPEARAARRDSYAWQQDLCRIPRPVRPHGHPDDGGDGMTDESGAYGSAEHAATEALNQSPYGFEGYLNGSAEDVAVALVEGLRERGFTVTREPFCECGWNAEGNHYHDRRLGRALSDSAGSDDNT